ncbi:hypothetical protein [Paenibacillus wenxiniae]|uniref:Uncharacterized protein n=1 Tax=Paenibacillus wenxiniae TaxID=1636843 RepID=A0ABW4RE55_9BACL
MGFVDLKGSDKQVDWAKNIREDVWNIVNIAIEEDPKWYMEREKWTEKRQKINEKSYKEVKGFLLDLDKNEKASDWINTFGWCCPNKKKRDADRSAYLIEMLNPVTNELKNHCRSVFTQSIPNLCEPILKKRTEICVEYTGE